MIIIKLLFLINVIIIILIFIIIILFLNKTRSHNISFRFFCSFRTCSAWGATMKIRLFACFLCHPCQKTQFLFIINNCYAFLNSIFNTSIFNISTKFLTLNLYSFTYFGEIKLTYFHTPVYLLQSCFDWPSLTY